MTVLAGNNSCTGVERFNAYVTLSFFLFAKFDEADLLGFIYINIIKTNLNIIQIVNLKIKFKRSDGKSFQLNE